MKTTTLRVVAAGLAAFSLLSGPGSATAQAPVLDIRPGAWSSHSRINHVTPLGKWIYFTSTEQDTPGLWRVDRAGGGLELIHTFDGVLDGLVSGGSSLLILNGRLLWCTDGTTAGTVPLARMELENFRDYRRTRTVLYHAGRWWMAAGMAREGQELWSTDGTEAGTRLEADIRPGTKGSQVLGLAGFGDFIYFSADDGVHGRELWWFNTRTQTARMVADLAPGAAASDPRDVTPKGSLVYFTAVQGGVRHLRWTDGVKIGSVTTACRDPQEVTVFGTRLLFSAIDGAGREPWITDGSVAGTRRVADLHPTGSSLPRNFVSFDGSVAVFAADDGRHGHELWRTDGTAAGTRLLADLEPGAASSQPQAVAMNWGRYIVQTGDVSTLNTTPVLWSVSASGSVTRLHTSGFEDLSAVDLGFATFVASTGPGNPTFLRTDGTVAGTRLIEPFPQQPASSFPDHLTVYGDRVVFTADDGVHGREPWVSDGTAGGTRLLVDARPGWDGSNPHSFTISDGVLYFMVRLGQRAAELWTSDGTPAGTTRVHAFAGNLHTPMSAVPGARTVLFFADDGVHGQELWWSNGVHTRMVADIFPGPERSGPLSTDECPILPVVGGAVFFARSDATSGYRPMFSDSTAAGTVVLGGGGYVPLSATLVGRTVYYQVYAGSPKVVQIWRTDGTVAGTQQVTHFGPSVTIYGARMAAAGGRLHFVATDVFHGAELWAVDAGGGVAMVADLTPGPASSSIDLRATADAGFGFLWFIARTPDEGTELYTTKGTAATTRRITPSRPGIASSIPDWFQYRGQINLSGTGDRVVLAGRFGGNGVELARVRSPRGDLERVARPSKTLAANLWPIELVRIGRKVLFSGYRPDIGRELFAVDIVPAGGVLAEGYGRGSLDTNGRTVHLLPIGLPAVGAATFRVKIASKLPNAAAVVVVGAQRADIPLGACSLLVAPLLMVPAQLDAVGETRVLLPIPSDTALIGSEMFLQAAVEDPGGCALGALTTSRGLWLVINE